LGKTIKENKKKVDHNGILSFYFLHEKGYNIFRIRWRYDLHVSNEDALKLINALRSGTTPLHHAETFATGRKEEIDAFRKNLEVLDKGSGLVTLITGDFGVGKTFLINAFKRLALDEDYVIADFQLNNGFRLNKLDDLYYAIMHNLYLKDKPNMKASFDDIFDWWVKNLQNAPFADRKRYEVNTVCQELSKYNRNYARAFLSFMRGRIQRNQEMMNVSGAWITGERNIPFALKQKYDLVGSVDKTNTLDFLKAFTKLVTLLDYKGLIVFIDEIDRVLHDRNDIRQTAYNNLKQLIDMSTSGEMPNIMFVFSGTQEILKDAERGILSNTPLSQRLNISQTINAPNNVANTSSSIHQNIIRLKPLDAEALIALTHKVVRLYGQNTLLPLTIDPLTLFTNVMKEMSKDMVTRHYITKLIEHLDLLPIPNHEDSASDEQW